MQGIIVSTAGPSGSKGAKGRHALYRSGNARLALEGGNARGRVIEVLLDGARSGVRRHALVYLPAAYFERSQVGRRFPVIFSVWCTTSLAAFQWLGAHLPAP